MKRITISDVGCMAKYDLTGDVLTMVTSGGCSDALNDNLCGVEEKWNNDAIIEAVREAWVADYEGDPIENDLNIAVE